MNSNTLRTGYDWAELELGSLCGQIQKKTDKHSSWLIQANGSPNSCSALFTELISLLSFPSSIFFFFFFLCTSVLLPREDTIQPSGLAELLSPFCTLALVSRPPRIQHGSPFIAMCLRVVLASWLPLQYVACWAWSESSVTFHHDPVTYVVMQRRTHRPIGASRGHSTMLWCHTGIIELFGNFLLVINVHNLQIYSRKIFYSDVLFLCCGLMVEFFRLYYLKLPLGKIAARLYWQSDIQFL